MFIECGGRKEMQTSGVEDTMLLRKLARDRAEGYTCWQMDDFLDGFLSWMSSLQCVSVSRGCRHGRHLTQSRMRYKNTA